MSPPKVWRWTWTCPHCTLVITAGEKCQLTWRCSNHIELRHRDIAKDQRGTIRQKVETVSVACLFEAEQDWTSGTCMFFFAEIP